MKARTWALRSLASLALLATAAGGLRAQAPAARPAAVVNGEVIPQAEVELLLKQRPTTAPQLNEAQGRQLQMEAVNMLIDDRLLRQFLKAQGPPVGDADIARWVAQTEASLKGQGHTLQEYCKERGMTEAQLRQNVLLMLQWAAYVNTHVSEADLKRYYDENREFFDQVAVRASHIVVRVLPNAPEAEKQAVRARLLALRQEIATGKLDFATAAQKNSHCPSAAKGGDIGYFPRKFMLEESFSRAAFALKVGEISDVVQTDVGMHLILVTDRKNGTASAFDKVKDDVREVASEELRQSILQDQRKAAKIEMATLDPAPAPAAN